MSASRTQPSVSPARPRRTQAQRRTATRAKILQAVVESIDEIGFQRTTAAEISRRSGLTWGAVQHHFGGKDGILIAVVEDSFDRFAALLTDSFDETFDEALDSSLRRKAPLEKRIDVFIDRAWEHFASPHYRSTFEILLQSAGPEPLDDESNWQGDMLKAWKRVWQRLFPDVKLVRGRAIMLQHYTISVLSGLASMQIVAGGKSRFTEMELEILKRTLALEFASSSTKGNHHD
jgi:AcrR family transcriptional regulator